MSETNSSQGANYPDAEATAEVQVAPDKAVEQVHSEKVDRTVQEVKSRLGSYAKTVEVMNSLSQNHGFNLGAIKKQEVVRGEIVLHCNNLYEYLNISFPEPENRAMADANKPLLEKLSTENPEEYETAIAELEKNPNRDWIYKRITYWGSAVNVQGVDEKVVVMNDLAIRRFLTKGGYGGWRRRTEAEKAEYEIDYKHTIGHEVQHVKFYNERGKAVNEMLKRRKAEGNLSPDEEEYIMVECLTKDEVLAHMYNELTPKGDINWKGIKQNLRKETYSREILRTNQFSRYRKTVDELVDKAKESFRRQGVAENPSAEGFDEAISRVTADLIAYHPRKFANFGKV